MWLRHGVGDLRRWNDGEHLHDEIGLLLTDFREQRRSIPEPVLPPREWHRELQSAEADVVQSLVIKQHAFVSVLHELMETQTALYGSTTVSCIFGDEMMEKVSMMRSGYSTRTLEIRSLPVCEPVPPRRER